jgi:Xaa-Pro dipeptidase
MSTRGARRLPSTAPLSPRSGEGGAESLKLGALLVFDVNNIRYLTGTKIGEWERDKLCRFALLAGDNEPVLWDFGSAAVHHRLYCDWLRRTISAPACSVCAGQFPFGRPDEAARRGDRRVTQGGGRRWRAARHGSRRARHVFALQEAGLKVADGQQVMLDAREIKNVDEITLLNQAAAMVDGVYHMIYEELKPGVRENDIVAKANKMLYEMGSDDVEAINAISGERCNPHPHNFTDRLIRPGDQAFFDILQSYMGYRTCYYRTFNVDARTDAQRDAYKLCREWLDMAIA